MVSGATMVGPVAKPKRAAWNRKLATFIRIGRVTARDFPRKYKLIQYVDSLRNPVMKMCFLNSGKLRMSAYRGSVKRECVVGNPAGLSIFVCNGKVRCK